MTDMEKKPWEKPLSRGPVLLMVWFNSRLHHKSDLSEYFIQFLLLEDQDTVHLVGELKLAIGFVQRTLVLVVFTEDLYRWISKYRFKWTLKHFELVHLSKMNSHEFLS